MRTSMKRAKAATGKSAPTAGTRPARRTVTPRSPEQQRRIEKAVEGIRKLAEEIKRMNPKPPKETSTDTLHKLRYGESD